MDGRIGGSDRVQESFRSQDSGEDMGPFPQPPGTKCAGTGELVDGTSKKPLF